MLDSQDRRLVLDPEHALFPCKNALPARNRLGVAQDTTCRVTPVGSSKDKRA